MNNKTLLYSELTRMITNPDVETAMMAMATICTAMILVLILSLSAYLKKMMII